MSKRTKLLTPTATELGTRDVYVAGSHIRECLDRTILDFEINSRGRKATNLYLGVTQWNALKNWAEKQDWRMVKVEPGEGEFRRSEYCGRRIYLVDAEDHLAAG